MGQALRKSTITDLESELEWRLTRKITEREPNEFASNMARIRELSDLIAEERLS